MNKCKKFLTKRILSRGLDYLFLYFISNLIYLVSGRPLEALTALAYVLLIPIIWAPIEALLIKFFNTTPGKWLFGLRVEKSTGEKISFIQGLKRALIPGWGRKNNFVVTEHKKRRFIGPLVFALCFSGFLFEDEIIKKASGKSEALFSFRGSDKEAWSPFDHPEGIFSIQFPENPKGEEVDVPLPGSKGSLSYYEYKTEREDGTTYSISYTTLPSKWLKWSPGLLLKGVVKIVASHYPHTKLVKKQAIRYKNIPSLDYVMSQKGNEISGRLILIGSTLYKLEVTYPDHLGAEKRENIAWFLESFEPN